MVGYGKNSSHGPTPCCRELPTCRFCGFVTLTTEAMIAHIDIHLAQLDASRARPNQLYIPNNQPPNLLNHIPTRPSNDLNFSNPSFRSSFPPPPPRPFFPGPVVVQRPVAMRPGNNSVSLTLGDGSTPINIISRPPNILPSQVFAPTRINNQGNLVAQVQQSAAVDTRGDDISRLLECPNPKVEGFVDLEEEEEEENGSDKLDLTLKL
ncbi:hypothetical protein TIFTF001_014174 [Ficus carica]|uniref:Uncharacterized protein n=1 Tax=Ficus carica TaxID=3494 RepID=A0AA88A4V1_FICCA|nr:hypothetical protein TIFTF001_014174 [Ficus carica]